MDVVNKYRKLDHRQHVLARPSMYVGSLRAERVSQWVYDDASGRMIRREIDYIPALFKIFDELLVNAFDHEVRIRMRNGDGNGMPLRKIQVSIDKDKGVISVENDGDGIDVVLHPEHGCYMPELIFGHLLTSTNYEDVASSSGAQEDDASVQRIIGGQFGIGAKATNILSRFMEIETVDHVRGKSYSQRFENNMETILAPKIRSCGKKRPRTLVRILPDYGRFGCDGISDDMYALLSRRVYDATAITGNDVTVHFNGKKLDTKSFERYADLYLGGKSEHNRVYEKIHDGWEVVIAPLPPSCGDIGMQHISFVNGIATLRGGKHVDHIAQLVSKRIADMIQQRRSKDAVRPQFVRDSLVFFVKCTIPNPTFDSQCKEVLTTPVSKFGAKIELSDKFAERVYKLDGLVDRVLGLGGALATKTLKKGDGTKQSKLYGIKKLEDAEWAGTAKSKQCTLILTEGDSAKAMAIAGLAVVGRQKFGVFPLRGKVMNVCDMNTQRIADNEEITNIKKILGLQSGKSYDSTAELRYGSIMILADADADGSHIKGLIMNLFLQQWPSLIRAKGFVTSMLTPVVKAFPKKGKDVRSFYNVADFKTWIHQPDFKQSEWRIKYYKGLGTSTPEEAREYFKQFDLIEYVWDDGASKNDLMLAFDKKRSDDRKAWLARYDEHATPDYAKKHLTFSDFVHKDLIHFSNYDLLRSIPSVMDGLKVSQRKVLFACLKRNLKDEIRVAQLAGYVSEHAVYHHGEASLHSTIVGMAQNFVGSGNNIRFLEPVGQFGTRLQGGHDSASPRYIHTLLTDVARLVVPSVDDPILRWLEDDGMQVEPFYYMPVIPLVLVNGAIGIGTGYSTSVPCHNPRDVINAVRARLRGDDGCGALRLEPWHAGFNGTYQTLGNKVHSRAVVQRTAATSIRVTELPVQCWTDDFKDDLERFIESKPEVKGYVNNSTDTIVDFTITFVNAAALDKWMEPAQHPPSLAGNVSLFEATLKLVSPKCLSSTNMHLFDPTGRIKHYQSVDDIVTDFMHVRMRGYEQRKENLLQSLHHAAKVLSNKARFIELVIAGELKLWELNSDSTLTDALVERGFDEVNSSFKYLLTLHMSSMTSDKKEQLGRELEAAMRDICALEGKTPRQLWEDDLDALEKLIAV